MELKARIDIEGALLGGMGPEVVQKNLGRAMELAVTRVLREVQKLTPGGVTGNLRRSIQKEVQHGSPLERGTPVTRGIVATSHSYGLVVERGRRAGMGKPPTSPIREWVAYKLGLSGDELERVTHMIRNKIATHGTEGVHMFDRGFDKAWPYVQQVFNEAGIKIVRELDQPTKGGK